MPTAGVHTGSKSRVSPTPDAGRGTGHGAWDTGRGVQCGLQDTGPGPSRDSDNPAPGPVLPPPHLALQVEVDERFHVLDVSVKLVGRVLTKETFLRRRGQEPSGIRKRDPCISLAGGLPASAGARGPVAPCTHTCDAVSWGAGTPGGRGRRTRPREESSRMTSVCPTHCQLRPALQREQTTGLPPVAARHTPKGRGPSPECRPIREGPGQDLGLGGGLEGASTSWSDQCGKGRACDADQVRLPQPRASFALTFPSILSCASGPTPAVLCEPLLRALLFPWSLGPPAAPTLLHLRLHLAGRGTPPPTPKTSR